MGVGIRGLPMVAVRLEQDWTDGDGVTHPAGEMVEVDAATVAVMEAGGVITDWAGGYPDHVRPVDLSDKG